MKAYTVTFILRDTQSHITSFTMHGESCNEITDNILEQIRSKGFVESFEAFNYDDKKYHFVGATSIASFNIKPN
jgi:hypothetical protein